MNRETIALLVAIVGGIIAAHFLGGWLGVTAIPLIALIAWIIEGER